MPAPSRSVLLGPKRHRVRFVDRVRQGLSWLQKQYGCANGIPESERSQKSFPVGHPGLSHWYRLNPPAPEEAVVAFEREHAVLLPDDYRTFITVLGDGGVGGDVGGINPLGTRDSHRQIADAERWQSNDWQVGVLARPFRYRTTWNLPKKGLAHLSDLDVEEDYKNADYVAYFGPVDGAIPICDAGCGSYWWLVVSGPQAGHVWHDRRGDRLGWASGDVSFSEWYVDWLEDAIRSAADGT